jgi:hypothetical protein
VTGRGDAARSLLAKVDAELSKRGAKRTAVTSGGVALTVYDIPPQAEKDIARKAVFFLHQDMLCAADSYQEAEEMIARFGGAPGNCLADVKAYQEIMRQCAAEAGNLGPEIRWFVDPFGYARAARSLLPKDSPALRGKDFINIFESQGFDAIEGVGGYVNLAVFGAFEILHRTVVYAPPASEGYRLAMRILKFPNGDNLEVQPWIPRKLASYRTFNFDLLNAYDHFGTLFDAIAGYDNAFNDVIEGLETDPYGPQLKVRDGLMAHFGTRVTLVTDYDLPITTKSERFLFVINLKNEDAVAATIDKMMEHDPNAAAREFQGKKIWEVLPAQEEVPTLEIPLEPVTPAEDAEGKKDTAMSTASWCVTDGHLLVASHLSFLETVLADKAESETLRSAGDFQEIGSAMNQLLTGDVAARCFVRTDEAYRPTYELLRQGKMPESETLLGRVLNRLLTSPEDEEEGVLRKQQIDGRQLPNFEMVRRYFSPLGTVVRSTDAGWFVVGATLSKRSVQVRADGEPPAVTATEAATVR